MINGATGIFKEIFGCGSAALNLSQSNLFFTLPDIFELQRRGDLFFGRAQARLELVAKNSSLTAGFFDSNLDMADRGRESLPHLTLNLSGNILSQ